MPLTAVEVETNPPYRVLVGAGALDALRADPAGGVAVLADAAVWALHPIPALSDTPRLELPGGEGAKTLARLGEVLEWQASARLSRASTLGTRGGGASADRGGLAASLFKRGHAVVHAPTTLLAQVDASVGGKTAINLAAGKNLAGTFHQPAAVYCDTTTLATLPDGERSSGLGEVVKTALVGGPADLVALEERAPALAAGDPDATAEVVAACVAVKARVVAKDPTERGPRRALNLGHTFAHAIEHAAGYGAVPHGVAVAAGIGLALRASAELGLLEDEALVERVQALHAQLGLPADLVELRETSGLALPLDELLAGFAHDKKGAVGSPEFVLVRAPGDLPLGAALDPRLVESLLTP